jgi:hypothetical protein
MLRDGGGFTTDLRTLGTTHGALGLGLICDGLAAWEAVDLLLVTAPRWLDLDADAPEHVVQAGPLDVRTHAGPSRASPPPRDAPPPASPTTNRPDRRRCARAHRALSGDVATWRPRAGLRTLSPWMGS